MPIARDRRFAGYVLSRVANLLICLCILLQAQFRRLAALRGPKRALSAVANSILTAGYYMLHRATTYQDLGPDYFDKRNTVRATHRLVKRLEALGHRVILESRFIAEPSS
jgi:hypothetical protein